VKLAGRPAAALGEIIRSARLIMTTDGRPGRAYGFKMAFCSDPECGLHIIPLRQDDTPICEIVMSTAQTLELIKFSQKYLYNKATRKEG
jgi:hypothetical protein